MVVSFEWILMYSMKNVVSEHMTTWVKRPHGLKDQFEYLFRKSKTYDHNLFSCNKYSSFCVINIQHTPLSILLENKI